jgi:zinc/manganese transport system substrate-binding protein
MRPEARVETRMKGTAVALPVIALSLAVLLAGCQKAPQAAKGKRTIVATYTVLASVVTELVGDSFEVRALIPNGQDPHEWEPSARDMEALNRADLVVTNGLGLEGGMEKALKQAANAGVRVFTASDAVQVRTVGKGEGIPSGGTEQAAGAPDPHLWMDPLSMKAVADALAARIMADFNVDVSGRARALDARLDALDAEIRALVGTIPADRRKLVTGHESMGYYARRYGFTLVGAIIPSLTTQAEVSASDMAALKRLISANGVGVVFTELGTPTAVAETLAREGGVKAVALSTHSLPQDGSYFTFERNLTTLIVGGLR